MAILRGIPMPPDTAGSNDQLWHVALEYLRSQQVPKPLPTLERIRLDDIFRLLERLSTRLERSELRRLWDLLIELAVVQENTLLPEKASHEDRLIKAIQHTGKLGALLGVLLREATSSV